MAKPTKPPMKVVASNPQINRPTSLQLGNVTVTKGSDTLTRIALLLWGPAGCGKSAWAATAPGDKLWLTIGDNEHVTVQHRDDVYVANFSDMTPAALFQQAQSQNPFGLDALLSEHTNIETVVFDSATATAHKALQRAVEQGLGASRDFRPTMEAPGIAAYGGRNAIVLDVLSGILRVTAKHNVHCIITAHEDDPTMRKDDRGNDVIDYVGVQLGGKTVNNMSWRLSEIWFMDINRAGNKRTVAVRPSLNHKPMKTRMFAYSGAPFFTLDYDAEQPDAASPHTIAAFYDEWAAGGYAKLTVPGSKPGTRGSGQAQQPDNE